MKTLVCIPGTFCDEQLWESQSNLLSDKYNFIFPSISTHDKIDDLASHILSTLPEKFSVIGMSAGAVVAFELLRQAPQRIEKLCIIAGNPNPMNDELKTSFDKQLSVLDELGIDKYFETISFPIALSEHNKNNINIKNIIIEMATRVGINNFKKQISMLKTRDDATKWLEKTKIPVLAICGEDDKVCPPILHKKIVDLVENGEIVTLPKTGHYINFENEVGLNKALTKFF